MNPALVMLLVVAAIFLSFALIPSRHKKAPPTVVEHVKINEASNQAIAGFRPSTNESSSSEAKFDGVGTGSFASDRGGKQAVAAGNSL